MQQAWARRGMHTGFWRESQKERNHYEDVDVGRIIILKFISEKLDGLVLTQFTWLKIGTSDRFLRI
jgi:hypothetical protein